MEDLAGWIATIATVIAAMMIAANLGARITGWGFVAFSISSISWTLVGYSSGQAYLVATNGFLMVTNLMGIWRWFGGNRKYEDGGKSAEAASRRSAGPDLFTASRLAGMEVDDKSGQRIGRVIEALIECSSGRISYIVVSSGRFGGIDETLRAVPCDAIRFGDKRLTLMLDSPSFDLLPALGTDDWPAEAVLIQR